MRMDGEAGLASGRIQRERKRSYKDFMQDLDDTELGVEEEEQEYNTRRHKEPKKYQKHSGNGMADPEECAVFLPACPIYVPQDGWGQRGGTQEVEDTEEIGPQDKLLHADCTAEGSTGQIDERPLPQYWAYPDDQDSPTGSESHMKSPVGSVASPVNHLDYPLLSLSNSVMPIADPLKCPDSALMSNMGSPASSLCCPSASDSPTAGAWAPGCIDLGPANVAAHLHLLGESLSLIGQHLQETNKLLWVSGGLSLLLDSLLCSLAPLTCLTLQIPELGSCSQHTMADTLDNIAYVMPGM